MIFSKARQVASFLHYKIHAKQLIKQDKKDALCSSDAGEADRTADIQAMDRA